VFFEGKDRKMLRRFAAKVPGIQILDNVDTAYFQSGGFGQWRRVVNADWTLENMFGMQIKLGCIFDRDFRSWEECRAHVERVQGDRENIRCFVLQRKEIENYALVVEPLVRAIKRRLAIRDVDMTDDDVVKMLEVIADDFKYDTKSHITSEYRRHAKACNRSLDDATADKEGLKLADECWSDLPQRLACIPAKDFISALSGHLQKGFGISVTVTMLIDEMRGEEVPTDLVAVLTQLEAFFLE
jgi:hypothetical protein